MRFKWNTANSCFHKVLVIMVLASACNATPVCAQLVDFEVMTKNYGESYVRGYKAYQQENYADAVKEYTKAIDEKPNVKTYYMARANGLIALKRNKEALEDLEKYQELLAKTEFKEDKSYLANIALMRGRAYDGLGQYKDAIRAYKGAIDFTGSLDAHRLLGELYRKQGKFELALDELIKSRGTSGGWRSHESAERLAQKAKLNEMIKAVQIEIVKKSAAQSGKSKHGKKKTVPD